MTIAPPLSWVVNVEKLAGSHSLYGFSAFTRYPTDSIARNAPTPPDPSPDRELGKRQKARAPHLRFFPSLFATSRPRVVHLQKSASCFRPAEFIGAHRTDI